MKLNNGNPIIDEYKLQEDLYYLYDNPDYSVLFEDLIKQERKDEKYVDLKNAFEYAYVYGLLLPIHDRGKKESIINMSDEDANLIRIFFNQDITLMMDELCGKLTEINKSKNICN